MAASKTQASDLKSMKSEQVKIIGDYISILKKQNADSSVIATLETKQAKLITQIDSMSKDQGKD